MRYRMLSRIPDRSGERSGLWWNDHIVIALPLGIPFVARSSLRRVRAHAGTRSGVRIVWHKRRRLLRLRHRTWVHRRTGGRHRRIIHVLLRNLHRRGWRRWRLTLPGVNWILLRGSRDRSREDRDDGWDSIRVRVWRGMRGYDLPPSDLGSSLCFLLPLSNPGMFHRILG
jgi:hypothetical protein